MSRYQTIALSLGASTKPELIAGLLELGLRPEAGELLDDRVMLHGSLECAGEPVDIRLAAGELGSVEDFGLVIAPSRQEARPGDAASVGPSRQESGRWRLICGEVDRKLLERRLIDPLGQALALLRARAAAERADLSLSETIEPDGTRRLRLRPRS